MQTFLEKANNTENQKIKKIYSKVAKNEIQKIYSTTNNLKIIKKVDKDSLKMVYFLNTENNNWKTITKLDISAVVEKTNTKQNLYVIQNWDKTLIESIDILKTDISFDSITYSPYKRYITYIKKGKWVNTIIVYSVTNNQIIYTSTASNVFWFNKNETRFFECKNSDNMNGFVNILSVPDMNRLTDLKHKEYVRGCENKWSTLNYTLSDTFKDPIGLKNKDTSKQKKIDKNIYWKDWDAFTNYNKEWKKIKINEINNQNIIKSEISATVEKINTKENLYIIQNWDKTLIESIDKLKTDVRFENLVYSTNKRYLTYSKKGRWVNTIVIYSTTNNQTIYTSTAWDIYWFNNDESRFIECKNSDNMKGFVNIRSVPDMHIIENLKTKAYVKACENKSSTLNYTLSDSLKDPIKLDLKNKSNKIKTDKNIYGKDGKIIDTAIDYNSK